MSDIFWQALFALLATTAISWLVDRASKGTARQLAGLSRVAAATHTLVNSSMAAQLKISWMALRRVAELTKHADDVAAAELARKLLREHDAKQNDVDIAESLQ